MRNIVKENYILRIILSAISFLIIGIALIYFSFKTKNEVIKSILNTMGAACVISGVYNTLYEAVLRKSMVDTVIEKVNLKKSIEETGLKEVYLGIDEIPYRNMIENAKSSILIMHSFGKLWTTTNIEYIKKTCQKRKIKLKVFLLNPESPFCDSLDKHYSNKEGTMKKNIITMKERWINLSSEIKEKSELSIYYFDGNPTHSIYVFDDDMVIIPAKITNDFTHGIPNILCNKSEYNNKLFTAYQNELHDIEEKATLQYNTEKKNES